MFQPFLSFQNSATLPTCAGGAVVWWETIHIYFGTVQNDLHIGLKYKKEIKQIIGRDLPLDPTHFILGVLPDNLWDKNRIYLLKVLLLIPKKMIRVSWLKPQPPSLSQWREGSGEHRAGVLWTDVTSSVFANLPIES
jgi:hypothetical protein